MLLGVIYFLLLFFVFSSIAEDRQRAENKQETENQTKVQDFRKRSEMNQLKTGIDLYESRNDEYPDNINQLRKPDLLPTSSFPTNPEVYKYQRLSTDGGYCLGTCLSSPDASTEADQQCVADLNLSCDGTAMTKTPDSL